MATIRASTAFTSESATTLAVTLDAGSTVGDLMLLFVQKDDDPDVTHWDPTGWTAIWNFNSGGLGGRARRTQLWVRNFEAGDTGGNLTGDLESWGCLLVTVEPATDTDLLVANLIYDSTDSVDDASPLSPTVTTTRDNTRVLVAKQGTNGDTTGSAPAGTVRLSGSPAQGGSDNGASSDVADFVQVTAGATGTFEWTGGTAGQDSRTATIALHETDTVTASNRMGGTGAIRRPPRR